MSYPIATVQWPASDSALKEVIVRLSQLQIRAFSFYDSRLPKRQVLAILRLNEATALDFRLTDISDKLLAAFPIVKCLKVMRIWNKSKKVTDLGVNEIARIAPALEHLDLIEAKVTDSFVEAIQKLEKLKTLRTYGLFSSIKGCSLRGLANCKSLIDLELVDWPLSDNQLDFISEITTLRRLALVGRWKADKSLSAKKLSTVLGTTSLKSLDLSNTPCTDELLDAVTAATTLEELKIESGPITLSGFRYLTRCQHLRHLAINAPMPQIDDSWMETLRALPNLESVELAAPQITAKSLQNFSNLSRLRSLQLHLSGISTKDAIQVFSRNSPLTDLSLKLGSLPYLTSLKELVRNSGQI